MIKILKDSYPPEIRFIQAGHQYAGQLKWRVFERKIITDFSNNSAPFINGTYAFNDEFGYEQFRSALERCQGPKCCFCEKPVDGGAIEHFRPKKAWQQIKATPINRPGYYWLAYRWSNMLIVCSECNSAKRKGILFPVNGFRATNHTMNYKNEIYEIINPANDQPSTHITFVGSAPIARDERGDKNIKMFDLADRGDLTSIRKDRYDLYATSKVITLLPTTMVTLSQIAAAKKFIRNAQKRKAPFAGMILENIRNGTL